MAFRPGEPWGPTIDWPLEMEAVEPLGQEIVAPVGVWETEQGDPGWPEGPGRGLIYTNSCFPQPDKSSI